MCPPTNFSVAYDINPWMTRNVGIATPDAARQWDRLVETLQCAGDAAIVCMEPASGVPDLVFTANAALVSNGLAIVSSFRHPERRREQNTYRSFLAKAGFATTYLQQAYFEGAGDALFDRVRPVLYAGYGWRSERSAAMQISETLGIRTVPLLLVDERFYHLDTCLCPLASGHVLAFMEAFSPHAQALLRRTIGTGVPDRRIGPRCPRFRVQCRRTRGRADSAWRIEFAARPAPRCGVPHLRNRPFGLP